MKSLKIIVLMCFILLLSEMVFCQQPKPFMNDITWAMYNRNIQVFNDQRLGESLKYGLDKEYVDNLISEDSPVFHQISSFYKETYAYIDFLNPVNKPYYTLEFQKNQVITFPEMIFYLTDNYSAYFDGPDKFTYVSKDDAKKRIEEYNLKQSTKIVIREHWYFNVVTGKVESRILDFGFIPNSSKYNTVVLWADFSYMKFHNLKKIRPKNVENITNITELFSPEKLIRDFYIYNYSTYPDQKKMYKFSNQINAYFWKYELDNQFRNYTLDNSIKKKWKKNKVKTPFIRGMVDNDKNRIGQWSVFSLEGKLKAVFTYDLANKVTNYELYYDKGTLKENGSFLNNRKQGTTLSYDLEGALISKQNWKEGRLNGSTDFYYRSGQKLTNCTFVNDSLQGEYKSYYSDGTLHSSGAFKKGVLYGNWVINVKLNETLCGYLKDETSFGLLAGYFEENAVDDCVATFELFFKHRIANECYNGICVIPNFNSLIR